MKANNSRSITIRARAISVARQQRIPSHTRAFLGGRAVFWLLCVGLLMTVQSLSAKILSWSGGSSGSSKWSDSANWGLAGTPASGDVLIFFGAQPRLSNTNDLSGLILNQICFAGSGGFAVYGNLFTVTNGIMATNTTGANVIYNDITFSTATQEIRVASGVQLSLAGTLSGTVGMNKTFPGTLTYLGTTRNTYSGTTRVNEGTLELGKTSGNFLALTGPLVIGDGTGTDTVRCLGDRQIWSILLSVTINSSGVLDINGFTDEIGALNITGGQIKTGAGSLRFGGNITVGSVAASSALISGNVYIDVSPSLVISNTAHSWSPDLTINANISGGTGLGLIKAGVGEVSLAGANSFSGPLAVNAGSLWLGNSAAAGNVNTNATVAAGAGLFLYGGVSIGNKPLTINGNGGSFGALYANIGSNYWGGKITLAGDSTIGVIASGSSLSLGGTVVGAFNLTKSGPGTVTLAGPGNTYTGVTYVNDGTLRLNSSGYAIGGTQLIVGDGTGAALSAVVQNMGNSQIGASVTINNDGYLNLNGYNDNFRSSLTLNGAAKLDTGAAGLAAMQLNSAITVNTPNSATVYGNLDIGTGTCTLNTPDGYGWLYANLRGSAGLVQEGPGGLVLAGANSFTGPFTVNGGPIFLWNDTSCGATNGTVTLNNSAQLVFTGVDVTNKNLVINSTNTQSLYVPNNTNSWGGSITLSVPTGIFVKTNCALDLIAPINGSGGFTKTGPGALSLSGSLANSYTGATRHYEGNLLLNKSSGYAIGSGSLIVGDGIGGEHADLVRYMGASSSLLYSGVLITITNTGWLDLNGKSDDVGPITLGGGDISTGLGQIQVYGNMTVLAANRTAQITGRFGFYGVTRTITVANGQFYALDLPASISDGGSGFVITSPTAIGSFVRLLGSNYFSGNLSITNVRVSAESPWALGSTNGSATVGSGGVLWLNNAAITNEALTLGAGASLNGQGTCAWTGPITLAGDATVNLLNGSTDLRGRITGTGNLTLAGPGTITFSGSDANDYSGATYVNSGCVLLLAKTVTPAVPGPLYIYGTVRLLAGEQTAPTSDVTIESTGLLQINGFHDYVNALTGTGSLDLGANWLVIGNNNASSTFGGLISGAGNLYKFGAGTITLTGNNTLTGITYINRGKLLINGSQPKSLAYIYNVGALGGNGTVGDIYCATTLSPGASPGMITCSNLAFTGSSTYLVELTGPIPGSGYDQVNVRGSNNLASATLSLTSAFSSPVGPGQQFIIINNDGTDPINGTFNGLPNGASLTLGNFSYRINYNGGNGNDVVLTLVDVPAASAGSITASGNGDGRLSPNECATLSLVITNKSGASMSGISAILTSADPNVMVIQSATAYPNTQAYGRSTNATSFQVSVLPSFPCGSNVNLNLNLTTTSHGAFSVPFSLPTGQPAATPSRFDVSPNLAIPDAGFVESTNTVSGFTGPLMKVAVSLYLSHTFDQDLTNISLISPDGVTVILSAANGGSGHDYGANCSPDASRTTFDDSASTSIASGVAPFLGTFRPQGSLASLNGKSANGNWRLRLQDGFGGSLGTLRCWSLMLYPVVCSPGGGACALCGVAVTNTVSASSDVQIGRMLRIGSPSACGSEKPYPGLSDSVSRYYHAYPFYNGASNACMTVTFTSSVGSDLFSAAYLGSFNHTNLGQNYLADSAVSTTVAGNTLAYSFTVPANTIFVVTLHEVGTTLSGLPYQLSVSGGDCAPVLTALPAGAGLVNVSWPTIAGPYHLEAARSLTAPVWSTVTNVPTAVSNHFSVAPSNALPASFYRLHKP